MPRSRERLAMSGRHLDNETSDAFSAAGFNVARHAGQRVIERFQVRRVHVILVLCALEVRKRDDVIGRGFPDQSVQFVVLLRRQEFR